MKREPMNQELLDRYIHSLRMLLPPDKMDDIAAEIGSNLESLVEDEAIQRGRELRPEEVSAILKRHGHPILVAGRYRDQATTHHARTAGMLTDVLVSHDDARLNWSLWACRRIGLH